jgi:hypothetical protein
LRRSVLAACAAATVSITAGATPAGASTTLRGRILGQPQVSGAHARVPVLLTGGAELVLTVPARSGFRTVTAGRTRPDRTRLGDLVSARVRTPARGGRARARYLTVVRRSAAPPFGELEARLSASSAGARKAVDEVGRISAAEAGGPQDPAALRATLLALRYQLNELIRGLRAQAAGMDAVRDDLHGLARAEDLDRRLRAVAAAARNSATRLEDGVTGLDEFINSIGGPSAAPLPAAGLDTVGQVLAAAMQTLGGLAPQGGLPGPLGGVPLPPAGRLPAG